MSARVSGRLRARSRVSRSRASAVTVSRPRPAVDHVALAVARVDRVVARARPRPCRAPSPPSMRSLPAPGGDLVVARPAVDPVVAGLGRDQVVARRRPLIRSDARPGRDPVVAGAAVDLVQAGAAVDLVVAGAAVDLVVAGVAGERVDPRVRRRAGRCRARRAARRRRRRRAARRRRRCGRRRRCTRPGAPRPAGTPVALDAVVAGPAVDPVRARRARRRCRRRPWPAPGPRPGVPTRKSPRSVPSIESPRTREPRRRASGHRHGHDPSKRHLRHLTQHDASRCGHRSDRIAVTGGATASATSVRRYRCSRGAMIRYAFRPRPSRSRSSESSGSSPVSSFTRSRRYATVCRCA